MKSYKGFNKDMTCRGFKYKEGKKYKHKGKVSVCDSGFHACEDPLECFAHYAPANSVYHEVEQGGDISICVKDAQVASSSIKIGSRIDIRGIVRAHFDYVKSRTTFEHTDPKAATAGECGSATVGDCGVATAGECGVAMAGARGSATAGARGAATVDYYGSATAGALGVATAGYHGVATAGECGVAMAGYHGSATAGARGVATVGDCGEATAGALGVATAGECGVAMAGVSGVATAGYYGVATSRGTSSVGAEGIACARGDGCKVKGGLGAVLVLVEENKRDCGINAWKAEVVDGKKIKADTYYTLKNGKFEELESEEK